MTVTKLCIKDGDVHNTGIVVDAKRVAYCEAEFICQILIIWVAYGPQNWRD